MTFTIPQFSQQVYYAVGSYPSFDYGWFVPLGVMSIFLVPVLISIPFQRGMSQRTKLATASFFVLILCAATTFGLLGGMRGTKSINSYQLYVNTYYSTSALAKKSVLAQHSNAKIQVKSDTLSGLAGGPNWTQNDKGQYVEVNKVCTDVKNSKCQGPAAIMGQQSDVQDKIAADFLKKNYGLQAMVDNTSSYISIDGHVTTVKSGAIGGVPGALSALLSTSPQEYLLKGKKVYCLFDTSGTTTIKVKSLSCGNLSQVKHSS